MSIIEFEKNVEQISETGISTPVSNKDLDIVSTAIQNSQSLSSIEIVDQEWMMGQSSSINLNETELTAAKIFKSNIEESTESVKKEVTKNIDIENKKSDQPVFDTTGCKYSLGSPSFNIIDDTKLKNNTTHTMQVRSDSQNSHSMLNAEILSQTSNYKTQQEGTGHVTNPDINLTSFNEERKMKNLSAIYCNDENNIHNDQVFGTKNKNSVESTFHSSFQNDVIQKNVVQFAKEDSQINSDTSSETNEEQKKTLFRNGVTKTAEVKLKPFVRYQFSLLLFVLKLITILSSHLSGKNTNTIY